MFVNKTFKKLFFLNLAFIVVGIVVILIERTNLPQKVPLFYSRPWGNEQLVSKDFLFIIPLFSLIILLINYLISRFLLPREKTFLVFAASGFSLLFSILGTLTLLKIIFLII